ncbi:DMT family transporter [Pseudalkalibacillus caeni]|uniref:Multidrug efflux SMR transporter n=1 Tax=Exobacillus caeni TaxID=2574798 RepID=A0A5R9F6J0_9BACL|nr:multidrug efflux SMR transporter [Pseudalkalibacillus caeni]TLS37248.1 multidrug efflux SMR transporter [Pseudalkalibacillus caeni]
MAWLYLVLAGITEVVWVIGLKYSEGFTRPLISILTILMIIVNFWLFSKSLKTVPIGTAYAVFTGLGAAGTAVIGMIFMGESAGFLKVFFILLMIGAIIGLKLTDKEEEPQSDSSR